MRARWLIAFFCPALICAVDLEAIRYEDRVVAETTLAS